MFKRLQQLEIFSGKAGRTSAVAMEDVASNAIISLILVLVLVVIPLTNGVEMIL